MNIEFANGMNEQVNEVLTNYGLDFRIEKLPLVVNRLTEDGVQEIESPYFGLLNTKSGEIINSVKDSYHVTQNEDIVKLALLGARNFGELSVQKAGAINGGRRVFIQFKIEGESRFNDEIINRYVTLIDSNDGTTGLGIGVGSKVMSCQNQFFKFYKDSLMRAKHTSKIEEKLKEIPMLIKSALQHSLNEVEIYKKWATIKIDERLKNQLVNTLLNVDKSMSAAELSEASTRSKNMMDDLYAHITTETNQKGANVFGLMSGVTSWTTRQIESKEGKKRDNWGVETLTGGNIYNYNNNAFDFLTARTKDEVGALLYA
jgi:hypothetical protein